LRTDKSLALRVVDLTHKVSRYFGLLRAYVGGGLIAFNEQHASPRFRKKKRGDLDYCRGLGGARVDRHRC
jgi:hypothetical protein